MSTDPSALAITLARIATHPMWMNYEEHPGDREAIKEASQILRNLTTEWGVQALQVGERVEPIVIPKTEEFARLRAAHDPDYWTLVSRKVATTDWEATS